MYSYRAKYQNGKLNFINENPNIKNSEVIVIFLNENIENEKNDRLDALKQLVSCFKQLPGKKRDEFDETSIRKPLLGSRIINL